MDNTSGDVEPDDSEYVPYTERPETYIVPVLFAVIFVVGVLGNGTLVVVFIRDRAMRNVPNMYIFSLALADLLVILICVPFASLIYTLESWPWGGILCRVSECAKDISIGVSVFTLMALSAERYCAIVNPFRKLQSRSMTAICACVIWLAATLCALPAALLADAVALHLDNNLTIVVCTPYPEDAVAAEYPMYNAIGKALIYYVIPITVIGCFYSLMARRLLVSTRALPGSTAQGESQARARRHVACCVLLFVVVFIICFLPYHVFELWYHLSPSAQANFNDWWNALRIIGFCLSFLNSCVNPVALYCVSGVFRQHFNSYLCCKEKVPIQGRNSRMSRTVICETSFRSTFRQPRASSAYLQSVVLSATTGGPRRNSTHFLRKNNGTEVAVMSINEDGSYVASDNLR